jgi:hypothetical protein
VSRANYQNTSIREFSAPVKAAPAAFTGGTENTRGDSAGTSASITLYTVTGDIEIYLLAVCTTLLAGSGKLEVGVTGNLAGIIAETTATDIDANDIWYAAAPAAVGVVASSSAPVGPFTVVNGLDILETTTTADITSGQIYYQCQWRPLSADGNLVAA